MIDMKYKNIKNRRNVEYSIISPSIATFPHSDDLWIPDPPEHSSYEEERGRTSDPNENFFKEDTELGRTE
jgi:hypothetical protein